MNVLVACESSGRVRDAFRALGHNAWSCDLLPCDADPLYHIRGCIFDLLRYGRPWRIPRTLKWDLMIAHPPCTYLCNSGVRWLYLPSRTWTREERLKVWARWDELRKARGFFMNLLNAPIPRICVENPIPHKHAKLPRYSQIIQPWQHGHGETKATCLWLRGLRPLQSSKIVKGRAGRIHLMSPGPGRSKERSKTYTGIAKAMAQQWGI